MKTFWNTLNTFFASAYTACSTRSSLQKFEKEISTQADENENVRTRGAMPSDRNYSVNLQIVKIARHTSDFDFEEEFEEI